jgi:zinc transport system substrate-binding protein
VAQTLAQLDPSHAKDYLQNLSALQKRLDELDATLRRTLAPLRGRAILVFHSAWSYYAEDYGLREFAIETEGKEPSDRELTELQRLARKEGVKVVFLQRQTAGRAAKALADAIGARTEVLDDLSDDVPAALVRTAQLLLASYEESPPQ